MSYIYLAYHPKQNLLAEVVRDIFRSTDDAVWLKDQQVQWGEDINTAALKEIVFNSTLLIFIDNADDFDPPDFLPELAEARRMSKPFFVITSRDEFDLLLPQIRSLLINTAPKASSSLPQLHPIEEHGLEPPPPPPIFRFRPGWLEISMTLLLIILAAVIAVSIARVIP